MLYLSEGLQKDLIKDMPIDSKKKVLGGHASLQIYFRTLASAARAAFSATLHYKSNCTAIFRIAEITVVARHFS